MSLDIKQAIQIGRTQLRELLPEFVNDSVNPSDIRLEEIERDGDNWAITFSFPRPNFDQDNPVLRMSAAFEGRVQRQAKIILVDGKDGKFLALRERAVA